MTSFRSGVFLVIYASMYFSAPRIFFYFLFFVIIVSSLPSR